MMLFGIDPAGMVVPTIGPRGLASMYSITGASTFQPHERCGQKPSRGWAYSAPNLARHSATRRWPRPYSSGIGDGRSLSSDRPDKAASYKRSAPGFVPLCIAAPGSIACDLDHKGSQFVLGGASRRRLPERPILAEPPLRGVSWKASCGETAPRLGAGE